MKKNIILKENALFAFAQSVGKQNKNKAIKQYL